MKHLTTLLAAVALLAAGLLIAPGQAAAADHSLADFEVGDHVTGPKLSGKDIKGRVVVLEYWGITCPPCIGAIPHTTELAKKYGHDKLVVIANQVWNASDRQCEEVWNKHAKNNHVMVVNGGELDSFRPRGVPRALIFDHTGKSIWEGHPGSMDAPLAEAIKNLPERTEEEVAAGEEEAEDAGPTLIVEGLEPEFFLGEVRLINEQQRSISATMAKLRRAAERATRPGQKEEAAVIVTAVETWVKALQAKADAALADDPATAYETSTTLVTLLEGDDLTKGAAAIIKQVEDDKDLHDHVRATLALRNIIKDAKSIGLTTSPSAAKDSKNARSVRQITRGLQRIVQAYPDSEVAKQAKQLQKDWGLGG